MQPAFLMLRKQYPILGTIILGEGVMQSWWQRAIIAAFLVTIGLMPGSGKAQQPIDVIIALPSPTLTFSSPFLAEDTGLYKKEGLNVSHRILVGVEAVNAVISGSADFTMSTGPVPAARGGFRAKAPRHRQSHRQAAGRDGRAQGRLRCVKDRRILMSPRAMWQIAEGQDHRHPGRRQHHPCLGTRRRGARRTRSRKRCADRPDGS